MDQDPNDIWNRKRKSNTPPNLDEWFKSFFKKASGDGGGMSKHTNILFIGLLVAVLVIFVLSGFYTVKPGEKALVLRFGAYTGTAIDPGLNWRIPGVDEVRIVETMINERYDIGKEEAAEPMITKDENIIEIRAFVLYRKAEPYKYLFAGVNPEKSVEQAAMSAMREVSGSNTLKQLLNDDMASINEKIKSRLESILMTYDLGIEIVSFSVEETRISAEVKASYIDVMKSREQKETLKNEGMRQKEKTIEEAKGKANAIRIDADKKAISIRQGAQAQVQKFKKLFESDGDYNAEKYLPQIKYRYMTNTNKRIMSKAHKIYISKDSSKFTLPLPTLLNQHQNGTLV
ncbi:MAG: FtsH protease activity modulator HflK [Candidatus Comchoanobacterales bacterium]